MLKFFNSTIKSDSQEATTDNILIVVFGESNSGGYAINSDPNIQVGDLDQRTNAYIFDNINNNSFDLLKCGSPNENNAFGHSGLATSNRHGFELEVGIQADLGNIKSNDGNVYILKAGQGGTKVTHWVDGTLYNGVDSWQVLQDRMSDVILELNNLNVNNLKIHVMFSLGINDAIAQTDATTWGTKTATLINNFRSLYNQYNQNTPIEFYATEIMPINQDFIDINNEILSIGVSDLNFEAIKTSDATQRDSYHWDYLGMRLIASRMLLSIKSKFNN